MGAPKQMKHECVYCFYPLSNKDRCTTVIAFVGGKRKVIRKPCPKCNPKASN